MDILTNRVVPVDSIKTIPVDESLVLVDSRSGQYFGLNEVGAAMWRLLEQGHAPAAIVQAISGEYDVSEATVAADLQRILGELAEAGLVH
jgi:PqqD family protein of HPr-rel-A system